MLGRRLISLFKNSPTPTSQLSSSAKPVDEGKSKSFSRKAVSFVLITITGGVALSALDDLVIYNSCSSGKSIDHLLLHYSIMSKSHGGGGGSKGDVVIVVIVIGETLVVMMMVAVGEMVVVVMAIQGYLIALDSFLVDKGERRSADWGRERERGRGGVVVKENLFYLSSFKALEKASKNKALLDAIGEPIVKGPWYNASLAVAHKRKSVSCTFPVSGPQGSGVFQLKAVRNGDDSWFSFLRPRDWEILIMEALLHVPANDEKHQTLRISLSDFLSSPACEACTTSDCKPQEPGNPEKK
uniref:Uncharacterized protein n=1 Tax=Quercus lobata TaxID=97700 RepID=A0A7N2MK08_QUELO